MTTQEQRAALAQAQAARRASETPEQREKRLAKLRAASARWYASNREKALERRMEATYGVQAGTVREMLVAQGGTCAICPRDVALFGGGGVVDHDHATGRVRGVLCNACNKALGFMEDDAVRLERAARYLRV